MSTGRTSTQAHELSVDSSRTMIPTDTTTGETTAIGTSCSRQSCGAGIARRPDDATVNSERADQVGDQDGEDEAEPAQRAR